MRESSRSVNCFPFPLAVRAETLESSPSWVSCSFGLARFTPLIAKASLAAFPVFPAPFTTDAGGTTVKILHLKYSNHSVRLQSSHLTNTFPLYTRYRSCALVISQAL